MSLRTKAGVAHNPFGNSQGHVLQFDFANGPRAAQIRVADDQSRSRDYASPGSR